MSALSSSIRKPTLFGTRSNTPLRHATKPRTVRVQAIFGGERSKPVPSIEKGLEAVKQGKDPRWMDAWAYLVQDGQARSVPAAEAAELLEGGDTILVDVRPSNQYEKYHPKGAINVQLFKKSDLSQGGFVGALRTLALAVNGVEPVAPNPDFLKELKEAAGDRSVVLMCEIGGTLVSNINFPHGKPSRSLIAAYKAKTTGALAPEKVYHLKNGIYGWHLAGLPFEGEYDQSYVGRTPMVQEEEIFSYGRQVQITEEQMEGGSKDKAKKEPATSEVTQSA